MANSKSDTPLADAVERLIVGDNRKRYVAEVVKVLREAALVENFKRYAALPLARRKLIAEEAGLDILKLSRSTAGERRQLQAAASRLMQPDRRLTGFGRAFEILTKTCVE